MIRFIVSAFAVFICSSTFSQGYYYNDRYYDADLLFEIGGGVGTMNSITDIGGAKGKGGMYINDINFKFTNLSSSLYFGVLYQQLVGVRIQGTWGKVEGADSILKGASEHNSRYRYNRNLNFKSTINEIAALVEFHPLTLWRPNNPPALSPYVVAGLGYFRFNPQIHLNGRFIDLKPLSTEGQNFPQYKGNERYNTKQVNVPVGLGVKYEINHRFNARLELLHRFLFTDYLDDVSGTYIDRSYFATNLPPMQAAQANAVYDLMREGEPREGVARGNADSRDAYLTFSLKLGVVLGREKRK